MAYKDKDRQRAYQRDWVRHKRGSTAKGSTAKGSTAKGSTPSGLDPEPLVYTEAKRISKQLRAIARGEAEPQSHNPMMVGYVPPQEGE